MAVTGHHPIESIATQVNRALGRPDSADMVVYVGHETDMTSATGRRQMSRGFRPESLCEWDVTDAPEDLDSFRQCAEDTGDEYLLEAVVSGYRFDSADFGRLQSPHVHKGDRRVAGLRRPQPATYRHSAVLEVSGFYAEPPISLFNELFDRPADARMPVDVSERHVETDDDPRGYTIITEHHTGARLCEWHTMYPPERWGEFWRCYREVADAAWLELLVIVVVPRHGEELILPVGFHVHPLEMR